MSQDNAIVSGEVTLVLAGLLHTQLLGPHRCRPLDGSLTIPVTSKVPISFHLGVLLPGTHPTDMLVRVKGRVQGYSPPHSKSKALETTGW